MTRISKLMDRDIGKNKDPDDAQHAAERPGAKDEAQAVETGHACAERDVEQRGDEQRVAGAQVARRFMGPAVDTVASAMGANIGRARTESSIAGRESGSPRAQKCRSRDGPASTNDG